MNKNNNKIVDALDVLIPHVRDRLLIFFKIREELEKESDRGCALLAAAFLENELAALLDYFLVETSESFKKQLFDFNGPLGTFSSRIKIAYALGLISRKTKDALDLIRKIRNRFAHLIDSLNFESKGIKELVDQLRILYIHNNFDRRQSFIISIQSVTVTLHTCMTIISKREELIEDEDIILPDNIEEYEIALAARYLMKITRPEISYEQAIEWINEMRNQLRKL